MEVRDSIGRRRQADQSRGLRSLFPKLPASFESRAVRIAMTTPAWSRIDALMAERGQVTRPRALGEVIETLLAHYDAAPRHIESEQIDSADWQAWQMHKERALLPALQMN